MDAAQKAAALAEFNRQVAACGDCGLCRGRGRVVPGEGRADAEIVFIGEAPGFHEDQQGRPFVGAAGQFLEQLLGAIGLKRSDVYICNVVKCRPPENRDPLPEEIEACRPWLDRQLEIIQPQLIVTLGRYSMNRYMPGAVISRVHGQPRRVGDTVILPMYHPAAALHQGSLRKVIQDDFKKIPGILEQIQKAQASLIADEPAKPQVEQMRLL